MQCHRLRLAVGARMTRRLALLMSAMVASMGLACSSSPDTPENAVMGYLTSAQVGDEDKADNLLCDRLRENGDSPDWEVIDRLVSSASVFGEGVMLEDDSSAEVRLEVVFAPSEPGEDGEPWVALTIKEGGDWKVCGFEPLGDG
jgi:hypothetical protein